MTQEARTTRKIGIMAAVLMTLALTVTMVAAGSAHFVGTPSISISGNTVTVSGKVAGLGNIDQINVVFTADAQCVNPGSHKPSAGNKQSVGGGGDFPVQNGKALFSLSGTATFQPTCTGPMTIEWSNITITVTDKLTGEVLATYP
jgi:hypothetical protein